MTKSSMIPKYDDLFGPTLEALVSLGGSGAIEEIQDHLVSALGLTQAQLDVTYSKSGALALRVVLWLSLTECRGRAAISSWLA